MTQEDIKQVFAGSLDTFKAFDDLTLESSGSDQDKFPTTIWQILHHLLVWQQYQLRQIRGEEPEKHIAETDTWIREKAPRDEINLREMVARFKHQLETIRAEISQVGFEQHHIARQLKVIQELTCHLSFHLGEVVLIRRWQGTYPWPSQMKEFLQT